MPPATALQQVTESVSSNYTDLRANGADVRQWDFLARTLEELMKILGFCFQRFRADEAIQPCVVFSNHKAAGGPPYTQRLGVR